MIVNDQQGMAAAIAQAERALSHNEVPIGAVVVYQGQIIGEGYNAPIQENDPSSHAEIKAIRAAAKHLGNYRLVGCTLYTTLEPCLMCAGAIVHARIAKVVYGCSDPKSGAVVSRYQAFSADYINHQPEVSLYPDERIASMLQNFFKLRR